MQWPVAVPYACMGSDAFPASFFVITQFHCEILFLQRRKKGMVTPCSVLGTPKRCSFLGVCVKYDISLSVIIF